MEQCRCFVVNTKAMTDISKHYIDYRGTKFCAFDNFVMWLFERGKHGPEWRMKPCYRYGFKKWEIEDDKLYWHGDSCVRVHFMGTVPHFGPDDRGDDILKKCSKCGKVKDISLFTKDKRHPDGHTARCKECLWPGKQLSALKRRILKRRKKEKNKRESESLSDSYIRKVIKSKYGLDNNCIDEEMQNRERDFIKVIRLLRERKKLEWLTDL